MKKTTKTIGIIAMAIIVFTLALAFIACGKDDPAPKKCECNTKDHLEAGETCSCGGEDCNCTIKPDIVTEREEPITLFEGKTATVKGNFNKADIEAAAGKIETTIKATFNELEEIAPDVVELIKTRYRKCQIIIVEKTSEYNNWKTDGDGETIYINYSVLNDASLSIIIDKAINSMEAKGATSA